VGECKPLPPPLPGCWTGTDNLDPPSPESADTIDWAGTIGSPVWWCCRGSRIAVDAAAAVAEAARRRNGEYIAAAAAAAAATVGVVPVVQLTN